MAVQTDVNVNMHFELMCTKVMFIATWLKPKQMLTCNYTGHKYLQIEPPEYVVTFSTNNFLLPLGEPGRLMSCISSLRKHTISSRTLRKRGKRYVIWCSIVCVSLGVVFVNVLVDQPVYVAWFGTCLTCLYQIMNSVCTQSQNIWKGYVVVLESFPRVFFGITCCHMIYSPQL